MALWTAWRSFYFLENRSGVIWNPLTSCSWRVVFSSHPTGWRNAKKKRSYDPNFPAAHDRCLSLQVPVNVGRLAFSFNHSLAKVGASAWQRRAVCERLSRPSRLLARVLGSVCSSSEESAKCTWGLYSAWSIGSVLRHKTKPLGTVVMLPVDKHRHRQNRSLKWPTVITREHSALNGTPYCLDPPQAYQDWMAHMLIWWFSLIGSAAMLSPTWFWHDPVLTHDASLWRLLKASKKMANKRALFMPDHRL